jgi:hypothetical protein
MQETLTIIMTWLSLNFGLAPTDIPAKIEIVPKSRINQIATGSAGALVDEGMVSVYDDRTRTIYLATGWNGDSPRETSILVHELVHHLQNMSAMKFPCPAARERAAYAAQNQWLAQYGLDLKSEFGIDAMTLKIMTKCFWGS